MQKGLLGSALALSMVIISSPVFADASGGGTWAGKLNPYTCNNGTATVSSDVECVTDPLSGNRALFIDAQVTGDGTFDSSVGGYWQCVNLPFDSATTVSFVWQRKGCDPKGNIIVVLNGVDKNNVPTTVNVDLKHWFTVNVGNGFKASSLNMALVKKWSNKQSASKIATINNILFTVYDNFGNKQCGAEFLMGDFVVSENSSTPSQVQYVPCVIPCLYNGCPDTFINPPDGTGTSGGSGDL